MENFKENIFKLNIEWLLVSAGLCGSIFSLFGEKEMTGVIAALIGFFVAILIHIARKKGTSMLASIGAAAVITIVFRKLVILGFKNFSNEISDVFGRLYGLILPMYQNLESGNEGGLIVFAIIFSIILAVITQWLLIISRGYAGGIIGAAMILFICIVRPEMDIWMALLLASAVMSTGKNLGVVRSILGTAMIMALLISLTSLIGYGKVDTGRAIDYVRDDKVAMKVTMEKPQSMYLKGFIGEAYKDGKWTNLDNENIYKYRDLFSGLHNENFYGANQLATAAVTFDKSQLEKKNNITIVNKGAEKGYLYTPYEFIGDSETLLNKNHIGDGSISVRPFGHKKYSYEVVPNQVKRYTSILKNLSNPKAQSKGKDDYVRLESHYNNYVYKNYTALNNEEKTVISKVLGPYKKGDKNHYDYVYAKEKILEFFSSKITYDESKTYSGDFVKSFLENERNGYAPHYASGAVLMMRYYGIPARYVEGYIISPKDIKGVKSNETFDVTGKNKHAWVEYYQDGAGWIPFEVTTPYIGVMESDSRIIGTPKVKEKPKKEKQEIKKKNYVKKKKPEVKEEKKDYTAVVTYLIVLLIILLIVAYLIYRHIVKKRRQNSFTQSDRNKATMAIYLHGYKALEKFHGKDIAEKMRMGSIYGIYQKARYSNHQVTEDEIASLKAEVDAFLNESYTKCSLGEKLIWKLVYVF